MRSTDRGNTSQTASEKSEESESLIPATLPRPDFPGVCGFSQSRGRADPKLPVEIRMYRVDAKRQK